MNRAPTERFSDRVGHYIKSRPGYPPQIIPFLSDCCGFTREWTVADIGSGTGIFTRLLLESGNKVFAVEPNYAMRGAAERELAGYAGFISAAGTAESTALESHSVKMVTSAQAFHWFDKPRARAEFERILEPCGCIVLLWNQRLTDTPFQQGYEDLLRKYSREYPRIGCTHVARSELDEFFSPGKYQLREFANSQQFDYEGLKGRLLSASYAPTESDPEFSPMVSSLEELFRMHNNNGRIDLDYRTEVFCGSFVPEEMR